MALYNIEELLEKYDNAETTLAEETQIREDFATQEVPPHLESYKILFNYVSHSKQETYTKELALKNKPIKLIQMLSVAAMVLVMLGVYLQMNPKTEKTTLADLSREELIAYNQTLEVFNLVSTKLNQGTENLEVMGLVSNKLNAGAEQLSYLQEFTNATNKIINN